MASDDQLLELMRQWERSGEALEEICLGDPQLLAELSDCVERFRSMVGSRAGSSQSSPTDPCAADAEAAVHHLVAERYQVLNRLGEGGMGSVFEAEDLHVPGRRVAIKFPRVGKRDRGAMLRAFHEEMARLSGLSCPGVVKVLDSGAIDEMEPYFVMELVRGEPLGRFFRSHKPSLEQRLRLVISACRAIDRVHRAGILHRDLKPCNILVHGPDEMGEHAVTIVDFGVSADLMSLERLESRAGTLAGTAAWMPPDVFFFPPAELDCTADVYSLGLILYNVVTEARPYMVSGDDALEVQRQVCESAIAPPREHCARLALDLEAIILKALERDRRRRYQTAGALADDLERFLRVEPVRAWTERSRPGRKAAYVMKKACWRRPVLSGILAGLSLLVVVLAVTVGLMASRIASQKRDLERLERVQRAFLVPGVSAGGAFHEVAETPRQERSASIAWRSQEEIDQIAEALREQNLGADRLPRDPALRLAAARMLANLDQYDLAQEALRGLPDGMASSWDVRLVQGIVATRRAINARHDWSANQATLREARATLRQLLAEVGRDPQHGDQAALVLYNLAVIARAEGRRVDERALLELAADKANQPEMKQWLRRLAGIP